MRGVAGIVETILPWSGGRRLSLLTVAPLSAVQHIELTATLRRVSDVNVLAATLPDILGGPVRLRDWEAASPVVRFEAEQLAPRA